MRSIDFNEKFEKKLKRPDTAAGYNTRARVSSASSVVRRKKKPGVEVEWVPRVTIPQPFSMTIREQIKLDKRQESVASEMRAERERRVQAEIDECRKKFRARPVPRHVHEKRFEQQRAEEAERRERARQVREMSEAGVARSLVGGGTEAKKEAAEFSAQPMPKFYFEEMTEEE